MTIYITRDKLQAGGSFMLWVDEAPICEYGFWVTKGRGEARLHLYSPPIGITIPKPGKMLAFDLVQK